jgi:hypothetical protein
MNFDTPHGTRGARQPGGKLMAWMNTWNMNRISGNADKVRKSLLEFVKASALASPLPIATDRMYGAAPGRSASENGIGHQPLFVRIAHTKRSNEGLAAFVKERLTAFRAAGVSHRERRTDRRDARRPGQAHRDALRPGGLPATATST